MIKVSIVVPVYNVSQYLRECLDSALNQSLDNIEIITVDDGSTDGSLDILKEYKEKFENIVLIEQENKGVSEARNAGIAVSKGDYIYFLDSDDYMASNLCEICYEECEKYKLDVLTFDANVIVEANMKKKPHKTKMSYDRGEQLSSDIKDGKLFYVDSRIKGAYACPIWIYFYNREFIVDSDISFYSGILHQDELFTLRVLLNCKSIKYIDNKLYFRRIRENSTMTKKMNIDNVNGVMTVVSEMHGMLKDYEGEVYNILFKHMKILYVVGLRRLEDANLQKSEEIQYIKHLPVTKALVKYATIREKVKSLI